jgi:hypothetical protein
MDSCDVECRVRLDAALAVLELSTARLRDVITSDGPDDAVELACASIRLSMAKFMAAQAEYREVRHLAF